MYDTEGPGEHLQSRLRRWGEQVLQINTGNKQCNRRWTSNKKIEPTALRSGQTKEAKETQD